MALAFPGGLLARRFSDRRVVIAALGFMAAGGVTLGVSNIYAVAVAGRLLSGVGAVLLDVLLTKMVADWFVNRDLTQSAASPLVFGGMLLFTAVITLGAFRVLQRRTVRQAR